MCRTSAVQVYQKRGLSLVPGIGIGYVVKDAKKWDVDPQRDASGFDVGYYREAVGKGMG